jgi:ubiquinone/menaquinone biosynthesis C-methylase UbiE
MRGNGRMNLRKGLLKTYWASAKIIIPALRYSEALYEEILSSYVGREKTWLDLGCGHQVLSEWRSKEERELVNKCELMVGVDYDYNSLKQNKTVPNRVRVDISHLPFKENSFDLATANMVVEHLECPDDSFQEIRRVLKPQGIFVFHTPNSLSYLAIIGKLVPSLIKDKLIFFLEGRKEEDVFKTYYRVNTRQRIAALSDKVGFKIMKVKMVVTTPKSIIIPPLMLIELIWIRILMTQPFKALRTNIIAILKKEKEN